MSDFLKQDIFFFITTIAVGILTILIAILIIYIIKISKDVKYISHKAKNEADLISQDLSELRDNIKEKGSHLKHFISFFNNLSKKKKDK